MGTSYRKAKQETLVRGQLRAPLLALLKRPEAVSTLAAAISWESDWAAFEGVVGLAIIDTSEARQALAVRATKALSPAVRRLAARAQTIPIVLAMAEELREKDGSLHSYILESFMYLRDPASQPALEEAMKSRKSRVRVPARLALRQIRRANPPQGAIAPAQK